MKRNKISWTAMLAVTGILGIFVGIFFYLDWAWDTYGRDYTLSVASFFVATIVAIVALWALKLTRDSLHLTRATQRPFLDVVESVRCRTYLTSIGTIAAKISNKGIFPADALRVNCEVHRLRQNNKESFSLPVEEGQKEYPAICFPGDTIECRFERRAGIEAQPNDEFRVYITTSYRNKLTGEEHKRYKPGRMVTK